MGQSAIAGAWDDRITLSSVSNYVNGVTTVFAYENDIDVAGPLAPGGTYTESAQFTLPPSVDGVSLAGTWYVLPVVDIHFAAGGNGFRTGSVGRDELAAGLDIVVPPPADLQVIGVCAPRNAFEGQPINVSWTVANNGNNQTSSGYWYDSVYLSADATFDPSQSTLVGTYGHFGVLGDAELRPGMYACLLRLLEEGAGAVPKMPGLGLAFHRREDRVLAEMGRPAMPMIEFGLAWGPQGALDLWRFLCRTVRPMRRGGKGEGQNAFLRAPELGTAELFADYASERLAAIQRPQ